MWIRRHLIQTKACLAKTIAPTAQSRFTVTNKAYFQDRVGGSFVLGSKPKTNGIEIDTQRALDSEHWILSIEQPKKRQRYATHHHDAWPVNLGD